jgi:DNA-directed RNA polymerase subunit alpha
MENIPLPAKIEFLPGRNENEATVSIQPCFPGYGTTLGNALRRVLLSSLPGAAVTAFKIRGVNHEFSGLPHVKEDVVEISLNLKQLRLKVFSDEPVRLELKAKGEKEVKAKDIKASSDVEIVNPDLVIATLTSKNAEFEMEILVNQGRGYVPTEGKEKDNVEVGMILVDSIFTPIKNVGIQIENVRVGQMTNYDNLLLKIETDGSVSPQDALTKANEILLNHFNFIAENNIAAPTPKSKKEKAKASEAESSEQESSTEVKEEKKAKRGRKSKKDKENEDKESK